MFKVGDKVCVVGNTKLKGFFHKLNAGDCGTVIDFMVDRCRVSSSKGQFWVLKVDLDLINEEGKMRGGAEGEELVINKMDATKGAHSHYNKIITGKDGVKTTVDVYRVLDAFEVTNPQLQHLIKKALCAGKRGHKDYLKDLQDIADSAQNAIDMEKDKGEVDV